MSRAENIEYIQDDCTANAMRHIERRNFELPVVAQGQIFEELRFMQDGVPQHFALPVFTWLDNHFSDGWIGRRGPTKWIPRSSYVTPFDLFL